MHGLSPAPSTAGNRPAISNLPAVRSVEMASQLRAAILEGDDARLSRLLSDLLRVKGLTKGQRVGLQLRTIMSLVQSLRSAALNDELTGLLNRRGFMQIGTRLLDLAARDEQTVHLVYLRLSPVCLLKDAGGRLAGDVLLRRMGNFMRDLFPSYGVYEVLGRLSGDEFAALTPMSEHVSRDEILQRARSPEGSRDIHALPLTLGVAHFTPTGPTGVDQLLQQAMQSVSAVAPVTQMAPAEPAPRPGVALC